MTEPLILKYRPATWDEVIGQDQAVNALRKALAKGDRSFLLSGPSGTGKTTLARIAATESGCTGHDITEIPAAVYTGVDDMRAVVERTHYVPLGGNGSKRAIILDEAHRLSRNAWDSLLKAIEEPPSHLLWFICTTEVGKIPNTIQTRCLNLKLKPVPVEDLIWLCTEICKEEKIKLSESIIEIIAREAKGSPRQMLSNLALCREAKDKADATRILRSAVETDLTLELCRLLAKGGTWQSAMALVTQMDDNAESVRIVVSHYFASAAKGAKGEKDALHFLRVLDAFAQPYNPTDGTAPLILSIGRVFF